MTINFYCVGAQKAGTTTLHDILKQHPDVFLPETKEAHFFDDDEKYKLGLNWYFNTFFEDYSNERVCGSCNPEYIYFKKVPKRIYKAFGSNIKLIFILRQPVDRAYSHYLMSKRRYIEELAFEDALAQEATRIEKDYFSKTHFSYKTRGFYAEQIKHYLNYFPKENMMFVRFEDDFIKNKSKTIKAIFQFLEIKDIDLDVDIKSNAARSAHFKFMQSFIYKQNMIKSFFSLFVNQEFKNKIRSWVYALVMKPEKKKSLSLEFRNNLLKEYESDIKELEKITNKDFSSWLKSEKNQ